jgi:aminopeptidase N
MKSLKLSSFLASAAILLIAAFSAFAQAPRPNFNRPQTFDAQNYTIRASFDRAGKKVFGDTTVSLKPLKTGFRIVELDAVDLAFESIKLDPAGLDLQYAVSPGKVVITLDKTYGPEDLISLRLKYSASPKKGVYFVGAETRADRTNHSAQIWTQGEAEEARHWFPAFDFPSDKATTEEYLTVEKGETVVGNGLFLGKAENADGSETWHYKMPVPHSTYLVSFVIGQYSRVEDKYKEIPLGFYVYPGREATAERAFGTTKNMIAVYEELTGVVFPYNKYDQTIVASFQFGGMENITATTMADNEIFFADVDFLRESVVLDLVSHELAHSWFGDLVTCKNWAELWLNEGFATYMEAAYREKADSRDSYMGKILADAGEFLADDKINRKRHALYNLRAADAATLFDNSSIIYHKGGVVLHMLREQVGTDAFWKAINAYLNRHKFGSVESTDLRTAMEEASGQDLDWFFDQWVYAIGAPTLDVRQVYSARSKTLKLTVTQTQKPAVHVPVAFRLPMDVEITTSRGASLQQIDVTKRVETFSIRTEAPPKAIKFDPKERIPLKIVKQGPVITLR